jgi:L,D-transpeptidase ErfK/SrfK
VTRRVIAIPIRDARSTKARGFGVTLFAVVAAALSILLLPRPVSGQDEAAVSHHVAGSEVSYSVAAGDSLSSVGARFGVEVAALASANGLTSGSRLVVGQGLRVDARHLVPDLPEWGIVVNVPQRFLFYAEEGKPVLAFPVAVGRASWRTPTGRLQIATRERHPVWDVPVSIQAEMRRLRHPVLTKVPPGPENPLGDYWMGLFGSGCGIHATNFPASIYGFRTHGCIRLHPNDAAELFARVVVGLPVEIVYRRVLLAKTDDGAVFVEVNPDPYGKQPDALGTIRALAARSGLEGEIDWGLVETAVRLRAGSPMRVDRSGTGN